MFEALIRSEVGAPRGSGRIWGDKSPSYICDLPLIRRIYPAARVVHIVRDVRDYCLSINRAWGKDMLRAAQRWSDDVLKARTDGAHMGDQYLEVHYEDLLQKPEAVLRQICAMLSIAFLPQMLELARPSENIGDAAGAKVIVADNFGKFSTRMSPAVLARIEAISGEAMLICGYSLATPVQTTRRLARHEAWLAKLSDAYQLVRTERKNRGLVGAITFHARAAVLRRR